MKETKDTSNLSPMVSQYLSLKKQYPDCLLFFRVGDFYELFLEDGEKASKELQLVLTRKASGNGTFIPMCGIPHHAYLSYANKLISRGYKVAICEQIEDPKLTKKLVKRDVIQIITPGANIDNSSNEVNYIASLSLYDFLAVIAYSDLQTGENYVINIENSKESILENLLFIDAKEVVVSTNIDASLVLFLKNNSNIFISYFNDTSSSLNIENLFVNINDERQIQTFCRLYNYLISLEKRELPYFKPIKNVLEDKSMKLDYQATTNMEIFKTLDNKNQGSLYWLLNQCITSMGSRYLKNNLSKPKANKNDILKVQNIVSLFVDNFILRENLRKTLDDVFDMEKLIAKMSYESTNGKDMLQLKRSLSVIPKLKELLFDYKDDERIKDIYLKLGDFSSLTNLIDSAIKEDCPLTITEGDIFKTGYNKDLDDFINLTIDDKKWLSDLEIKEKERTGIKNLHVGYSPIYGYYIEVSQSQISEVKEEYGYIRKQTLKTGERYITVELKEREERILRAKDNRIALETKLFKELRKIVSEYTLSVQDASLAISSLDYYLSLAFVSSENNYVKPIFSDDKSIDVKDARHPIIEKANPERLFVKNDYIFSSKTNVIIITGPNMGGKSTYMKEFGLIVLLAQLGCYVPASYCKIPVFDSIHTRIGASDNLIKGQSTFMLEMSEVALAVKNATPNSLFLFDEIGRGTATYDGMSLAQAIIEYIVKYVKNTTFFSTHYHEITKLSEKIKEVENIHCLIKENDGEITFLYKMVEGSISKSYGINVAKLALLPDEVILRASELLSGFENNKNIHSEIIKEIKVAKNDNSEVISKLKKLDPLTLSPLEALNYLINLKKEVK